MGLWLIIILVHMEGLETPLHLVHNIVHPDLQGLWDKKVSAEREKELSFQSSRVLMQSGNTPSYPLPISTYRPSDPGIYSLQLAAGGQLLESWVGGLPEGTYSMTITVPLFDGCENQVLKRLRDLPSITNGW